MGDLCRYSKALGRLVFLLATTSFAVPCLAQNEFQVIVNGPWAYYKQNGRLYLIAPGKSSHNVYIYGGTDVGAWASSKPVCTATHSDPLCPISQGTYMFDPKNADFKPGPLSTIAGDQPVLYDGSSAKTDPGTVIGPSQTSNYVISLPLPNAKDFAATTYDDQDSPFEGYSESRVWKGSPTKALAQAAPPTLYTTIMVLHYGLGTNPIPPSLTLSKPVNGSSTISTTAPTGSPQGVTIVAGDTDSNARYLECDDVSLMSSKEREMLWNTGYSALFPEEVDQTGLQSHHYQFDDCLGTHRQRWPLSGGSGDCHMAQMDLNSAIPGEKIIP